MRPKKERDVGEHKIFSVYFGHMDKFEWPRVLSSSSEL